MVMRVVSSHHTSTSKRPSVAEAEATNATTIARLISVIMPGRRSDSSVAAPRTKTMPPYRNTIVPRIAGMNLEPGKDGAV